MKGREGEKIAEDMENFDPNPKRVGKNNGKQKCRYKGRTSTNKKKYGGGYTKQWNNSVDKDSWNGGASANGQLKPRVSSQGKNLKRKRLI